MKQEIIKVKVRTGVKRESIETLSDGRLCISVNAKKEKGAANMRTRELLANYFHVSVDAVTIRSGHTSQTKTLVVIKVS